MNPNVLLVDIVHWLEIALKSEMFYVEKVLECFRLSQTRYITDLANREWYIGARGYGIIFKCSNLHLTSERSETSEMLNLNTRK